MAFFDKLGDIARNIGDKATDAIETTKLNSKINAEKTAISEDLRQIGSYYYKKYQDGEAVDGGVLELVASIDGHNNTIAETQAEITRIQEENAAQAAQAAAATTAAAAAAPAAIPVPIAGIICSSCGKANTAGTKFCNDCGARLEEPAAPQSNTCPECGTEVDGASKFCGSCGYKFE